MTMERWPDVAYSENDAERRKMDVFVPGDNANGIGLLFIHGGGWHAGSRTAWHPVAERFCGLGYSCASVGYRLAPDWHYPAPVEDVRLAMSYFLENADRFRFDGKRTAAIGSSAGGHLAAMLATIPAEDELGYTSEVRIRETRPTAAVLYCAATNLRLADNVDSLKPSIEKLFGRPESEIPESYALGSPYDRIDGRASATLLIHGDADETIPVDHSRRYYDKLVRHGVKAELCVLPGVRHGFGYGASTPAQLEAISAIERFFAGIW
ncbi:alpha/beta hydrolase [Paenibacillus sp. GYB003]|uniref:alpha/beta hydrolase n=1 Tax=Paenibacillus sp. GYB003 TaxID=2994392 RepID=UPI002F963369